MEAVATTNTKLTVDECLVRIKPLYPTVDAETFGFWRRHHLIPVGEKIGVSYYYDLKQFGEWIGYILFLRDTFGLNIDDIKKVMGVTKGGKLTKDTDELLAMTEDFARFQIKMKAAYGKKTDPYSLMYATRTLFGLKVKYDWDDATLNKEVKARMSKLFKI